MSERPIDAERLARKALVYLRQSSEGQVRYNRESQRLQYDLVERARELGWTDIQVIDADLGASASVGAADRDGFNALIAAVATGDVGVVFAREVSRMIRTDKDWCRVVEICHLFDTLLGDDERLYDLDNLDDQLVLGIKATLSVVELKVLEKRLRAGAEAMARRGELYRDLTPGYVRNGDEVAKDPNERVQQAIELVFRKFGELWSIRQTVAWFHANEVELPVNSKGGGSVRLSWQLPSYAFISGVLHNPFYAGAYTYGRRQTQRVLVDGEVRRRTSRVLSAEECRVLIKDHHEGYIDWETYQKNLDILRRNSCRGDGDGSMGAVRGGRGLLAGLLRCGRCGRRLHVRYAGRKTSSVRYLCHGDFEGGGRYCLGVGAAPLHRRFSEELLGALSPLGVEASLAALDRFALDREDQRRALDKQLQQVEYEANRAFEQYNEVDPRNRLVAAQLERRWEDKLAQVQSVQTALSALDDVVPGLDDESREAIMMLGRDFAAVWSSEHCPLELKKKIVCTVVEEIIVALDDSEQNYVVTIHWKGGTHTRFELDKPKSAVRKTATDDLEVIRRMAPRYGDGDIARVLNKLGRRTVTGRRWNQQRVQLTRRNYKIPGRRTTLVDPELLTLAQAAQHCGVSDTTIRRLVESQLLPMNQVVAYAPWEIRIVDLDTEPVRGILSRFRATGKLVLEGDALASQLSIFE
jgi:DNA invertase Pin-like site-specific DNA recombinase